MIGENCFLSHSRRSRNNYIPPRSGKKFRVKFSPAGGGGEFELSVPVDKFFKNFFQNIKKVLTNAKIYVIIQLY